ncbi:hypothetical protein BHM03_00036749, partial [Ensete ventricosum]
PITLSASTAVELDCSASSSIPREGTRSCLPLSQSGLLLSDLPFSQGTHPRVPEPPLVALKESDVSFPDRIRPCFPFPSPIGFQRKTSRFGTVAVSLSLSL